MISVKQVDHYEIRLDHDGDEMIEIHDCEQLDLHMIVDKRIHAQLFITYDGMQMQCHTHLQLGEDSDVAILFWNKLSGQLELQLDINGQKDAKAHIGIGDLSSANSSYELYALLDHMGMDIHTTSVCKAAHKSWQIEMKHECPHTTGIMENFAVVETNGDYHMVASGRIVNGAHNSESHQSSRVLTLSQAQRSEVLPILYIDENDVKASHATTLGQPDEAQLYYLQSRGLSRKAALGLLTMGYFLPILQVVNKHEWQEQLQKQIEEKVIVHD